MKLGIRCSRRNSSRVTFNPDECTQFGGMTYIVMTYIVMRVCGYFQSSKCDRIRRKIIATSGITIVVYYSPVGARVSVISVLCLSSKLVTLCTAINVDISRYLVAQTLLRIIRNGDRQLINCMWRVSGYIFIDQHRCGLTSAFTAAQGANFICWTAAAQRYNSGDMIWNDQAADWLT